jgi:hypothetical protein
MALMDEMIYFLYTVWMEAWRSPGYGLDVIYFITMNLHHHITEIDLLLDVLRIC